MTSLFTGHQTTLGQSHGAGATAAGVTQTTTSPELSPQVSNNHVTTPTPTLTKQGKSLFIETQQNLVVTKENYPNINIMQSFGLA